MMDQQLFMKKSAKYLSNAGFATQQEDEFLFFGIKNPLHLYKKMRAGVFTGTDHYFLLALDPSRAPERKDIEIIHETSRRLINSQIKMPRAFRWHVPNIVTVIATKYPPDEDTLDYINSIRRPWQGGEVHNVIYIDLSAISIHSHGTTEYNIYGLFDMKFKKVDPSNRSFFQIRDMCEAVLKTSPEVTIAETD